MPARHTSLPTVASLGKKFEERLMSTKEGVGETSGQTAGSSFEGARSRQRPVRQKKQVFFVRCDPTAVRNFLGPRAQLPDDL